ncbi:MAG: hypothetical protein JW891_08735 [Candidatus Lokiarchaeota archaeon]|nr:hypothetical protein [Candidatus Lokiarchaeota archaeon]
MMLYLEDADEEGTTEYIRGLVKFGLSKEEANVYLSLLKRGTRGEIVGRIKDELNIGRTTIYAIMERLTEKGWVVSTLISEAPRRFKYVANPPYQMLNDIIENFEKNLKNMKDSSVLIGDKLDIRYQGAKKLTIDSIHIGARKYLEQLVKMGWKIKSEVVERSEYLGRLTLDYELKGSNGIPKDCGLIVFFFDRTIENDEQILNETFNIFKKKTEHEIRKDKIPSFEDVRLEEKKIENYRGAEVYIKLKFKKKWRMVGKQAIVPIDKKIFLIFGNEQNFKILLDTIIKGESFHHLV